MHSTLKWKILHFGGFVAALIALFIPVGNFFSMNYSFYSLVSMFCKPAELFLGVWAPLLLFAASAVTLLLDYYKYAEWLTHITAATYICAGLYWTSIEDKSAPLVLVMIVGVISAESGIYFLLSRQRTENSVVNTRKPVVGILPKTENVNGVVEFTEGDFRGAEIPLEGELVIGKNAAVCNIVVTDKTCSRIHCKISFDEKAEKYMVRDFSTNGTYLGNGERLAKESDILLERGTVLSIGSGKNRFKLK